MGPDSHLRILVRQLTKSHNGDLGPLRREHSMTSNYSSLVVEKELERRRKLREAKMRQESNPYNFNSGKIPRQAGGNINPQKAAEAYYNAKEREEGTLSLISTSLYIRVQPCTFVNINFSGISGSEFGRNRWSIIQRKSPKGFPIVQNV